MKAIVIYKDKFAEQYFRDKVERKIKEMKGEIIFSNVEKTNDDYWIFITNNRGELTTYPVINHTSPLIGDFPMEGKFKL